MNSQTNKYQQISFAVARVLNRIRIIIAINIEYSKYSILLSKMKTKPSEFQQISIAVARVLNRI
jgi:hypothetical protein